MVATVHCMCIPMLPFPRSILHRFNSFAFCFLLFFQYLRFSFSNEIYVCFVSFRFHCGCVIVRVYFRTKRMQTANIRQYVFHSSSQKKKKIVIIIGTNYCECTFNDVCRHIVQDGVVCIDCILCILFA